jgi:type IV pilus assembly protein PilM
VRLGLDIGASAIKLAAASGPPEALVLEHAAIVSPPELLDLAEPAQCAQAAAALRELLGRAQLPERRVALAISPQPDTVLKRIALPLMTAAELAEQIPWEAEQHVAADGAQMAIAYQVVSTREAEGQMDVLVAATRREHVARAVELAIGAGLQPTACVLDMVALHAWLVRQQGPASAHTVVVDLGAASTRLLACDEKGSPVHFRRIPLGGEQATRLLQEQLGVTRTDAERLKQGATGAERTEASYRIGSPADAARVEEIAAQAVAPLVAELRRAIDHLATTAGAPGRVVLTGGSVGLGGLATALGRDSACPVEPWSPGHGLMPGPALGLEQARRSSPVLGPALGVCLAPGPAFVLPAGGGAKRGGWLRSLFG